LTTWSQYFSNGYQSFTNRTYSKLVRATRRVAV
jgi:hypothetical protein